MNNSPKPLRAPLTLAVVVLVLSAVAALLLSDRSRNAATLRDLRREVGDLRALLEARDSTVSSLQADIHQLRGDALAVGGSVTSPADLELARRMSELALQQSNIAVTVERLLTRTADTPSPAVSAQRQDAAIVALEAAVQDEQQRLEVAKERAAELLIRLSIPAEVSTMDAAKALDTASLRAFWPYFEAKRERDLLLLMAERLQLRLIQERVDAGVKEAR